MASGRIGTARGAARTSAARLLGAAALTLLAVLACQRPAGAEPADLPALAALETGGGLSAGLVVDLERGRVLAARNADLALAPASVVKLVTAGLALETWGPAHRFVTRLLRRGPLEQGVLRGDLVLRGGGDASLTDEDFWRMARSLAQLGLVRVEGRLLVDEGHFGPLACGTLDRCEALRRSAHAYDAPLTSTPVDYNLEELELRAGEAAGEAGRLLVDPFPVPGIRLEGSLATAAATGAPAAGPTVVRVTGDDRERLLVSGSLPAGTALTVYRSLGAPARHAGELFAAFLAEAGIAVTGGVEVSHSPVEGAELLLGHQGATLDDALGLMLGYSNNLLADSLALNLLLDLQPGRPAELMAAGALLSGYLGGAQAGSAFPARMPPPPPQLLDGSGLEPANRLTARQLVQLLERLYRRPALFPTLAGALTVPASGPQRSLPAPEADGGAAWNERILVKTGGLSEPIPVTSLAGFFRFADGGWGAFAFLVNGAPDTILSRGDAFYAMRRDLSAHWKR